MNIRPIKKIFSFSQEHISNSFAVVFLEGYEKDGQTKLYKSAPVFFDISEILKVPKDQPEPQPVKIRPIPGNPTAHLIDPNDPEKGVKTYIPKKPKNRQETYADFCQEISKHFEGIEQQHKKYEKVIRDVFDKMVQGVRA